MFLFLLLFFHHLQFETVFFIVSIVYTFVVDKLEKSKNNESGPYVEKVAEFKISGRVLKYVGLSSEWVSREGTTITEYINFLHFYFWVCIAFLKLWKVYLCVPWNTLVQHGSYYLLSSLQLGLGFWHKLFFVLRGLVGLLFGCSELASGSGSMYGYVSVTLHNSSVWEDLSGERSRQVPGVFYFSSTNQIVLHTRVNWVVSHYRFRRFRVTLHALAYNSSCSLLTSGSGFHVFGMICTSSRSFQSLNWRIRIPWRTRILLVPILRTR